MIFAVQMWPWPAMTCRGDDNVKVSNMPIHKGFGRALEQPKLFDD